MFSECTGKDGGATNKVPHLFAAQHGLCVKTSLDELQDNNNILGAQWRTRLLVIRFIQGIPSRLSFTDNRAAAASTYT
ncbi:hypothetical protein HO173_004153 [Letharia columbiana]|uniref:Uncharacterized protein n=1 Tax=Letharia columbiana TaxID=112416 RepID=A0A8H6L733_9LECA|nr:uncharacterized protein HO173_004153 [Letharia columbiana]KAF6237952.1 hypothetical protein HO173_004153 [Letharia columbiana]